VGLASPVSVSNTPDIRSQLFVDDLSSFDFPSLVEDLLHLVSFILSPAHYPHLGLNNFQEVVPDTTSSNADIRTHKQYHVAVLLSTNLRIEASTAIGTGSSLTNRQKRNVSLCTGNSMSNQEDDSAALRSKSGLA
jgi:hypothetical protein